MTLPPIDDLRARIRAGAYSGSTVGLAPGRMQGNLVVVPAEHADAFEAFCRANPQALPLIERGRPGDPHLACAVGFDVRVDVPAYRVFRRGLPPLRVTDIAGFWRADSVAFVLGCWFGNESALARAGIRMRHLELGLQGGLYVTDRPARAAGPFRGPLVVSMRPFSVGDVPAVVAITTANPSAHGPPVGVGDFAALGIRDAARPDYGDAVLPEAGEVPIFWACGVTGEIAATNAGLDLVITHEPGAMVVTDRPAVADDPAGVEESER